MNTERTEKFVNAIACDLEEGGFRQVSGTTLRRTLATAVSAALPLLEAGNPVSSPAGQGDDLLPCPFCGNNAEFVPYKGNGLTVKCKSMGCIQRHQRTLRYGIEWLRASMTEHWNARALAARQPGAQEEVTDAGVEKAWNRFEAALQAPDGDTPEDRVLSQIIDQRDRYHEVADELADHLARITGVEIGEHSSVNCPWQNAIEAAETHSPAQGIDPGQFERLANSWIVEAAGAAAEAKHACADELLALIYQRDAAPGVGQ